MTAMKTCANPAGTGFKLRRLRFAEQADALQKSDAKEPGTGRFIFRQGAAAIDNIGALLASVDTGQLEAAAARLVAACRVLLVGNMSSRPFVDYMAYMASMAFDNWRVVDGEARSMAAALVDADDKDAAIVVCKAPYARRSIDTARQLREQGVWTIGITDEGLSPLHPLCAVSFVVSTETPQFFSSHVATLVLIEALVGLVIAGGGDRIGRRLAAVESASHEMGDYFRQSDT